METTKNTAKVEINAKACGCGCKTPVGPKSNYRPGHDARHVSVLIEGLWQDERFQEGATGDVETAIQTTLETMAVLPSYALQIKFYKALDRKVDKEFSRYCRQSDSKNAKIRENASCKFGWHPDDFFHGLKAGVETLTTTPNTQAAEPAPVVEEQTKPVEISADGDEIKIGRWTYPTGSRPGQDTIYRNTKRDGSGEWVEVN